MDYFDLLELGVFVPIQLALRVGGITRICNTGFCGTQNWIGNTNILLISWSGCTIEGRTWGAEFPVRLSNNSIRAGDSMSEIEPAPAQGATDNKPEPIDYRARLEEVADLVARVRHEINNPLTGVLGQAQLLLREELSERARRRAQSIEDLAIRLRDIVAQLRDVQRPQSEE